MVFRATQGKNGAGEGDLSYKPALIRSHSPTKFHKVGQGYAEIIPLPRVRHLIGTLENRGFWKRVLGNGGKFPGEPKKN